MKFPLLTLILIGGLYGCNTTSIKDISNNLSNYLTSKPTPEEAMYYAKNKLYCSENEIIPTNESLKQSEKLSSEQLITVGRQVSKAYPTYFTNKNCQLAAISYAACKGVTEESECIKGYMFTAITYDKPELNNIEQVLLDRKKQSDLEEHQRQQYNIKRIAYEKEMKAYNEELKIKAKQEESERRELNFQNALRELKSKPEYTKTYEIIMKKWDEKSRDELRQYPEKIFALHADVKSGVYDRVEPYAEKIKQTSAKKSSDLEYYMRAGAQYYRELDEKRKAHIERLANNETQLDANIYWHVSQINEKKLKLVKLSQGSASHTELSNEIAYLTKELAPLEEAKALIKQRENEAYNRKLAQEREYQNQQLQQQRQAQQAQAEYQSQQLEIQKQQLKQAEEAESRANLQRSFDSFNKTIRKVDGVTCTRFGNMVTCN